MKKVMILSLAALVMAFMCTACGGGNKQVKEDTGPEVLLPGELVENMGVDVDMVKCSGKHETQQGAFLLARKGCLEWMITHKLAQTPAERQAYLRNQKDIMSKVDRYVAAVKPGAANGKGEGLKRQHRISDGRIQVEVNVKVFKKVLQDDLVAMNIIASKDDMLDAAGNPTLVVLPSKAIKGKAFRKELEGQVNDYLITNKWEVIDLGGAKDLDKMIEAMAEEADTEEDAMANIAAAAGADVYIVFEATPENSDAGGQVWKGTIWGFETTTKRKLASKFAISTRRYKGTAGKKVAGRMEAIGDAMGQVLPQISSYWKEDARKGSKFRVYFKNPPKNTDIKMKGVLKKACTKVKVVKALPQTVEFYVQCKGDNTDLAGAIIEGVEAKLGGAEHTRLMNRNSIILTFN